MRTVLSNLRRLIFGLIRWLVLLGLMLFLLQYSTYPTGLQWNAVALLAGDFQFDYVTWEIDALAGKVNQTLYGLHPFMTEEARVQYVRDYMDKLQQAEMLDGQINAMFSDPKLSDPETASAEQHQPAD